jgi:hypothetical protein
MEGHQAVSSAQGSHHDSWNKVDDQDCKTPDYCGHSSLAV